MSQLLERESLTALDLGIKLEYVWFSTSFAALYGFSKMVQEGNRRFPDDHFPGLTFPGNTFFGKTFSERRYPERRFPESLRGHN